jgi:hypothetical protein
MLMIFSDYLALLFYHSEKQLRFDQKDWKEIKKEREKERKKERKKEKY